jgi:shikimate kinase
VHPQPNLPRPASDGTAGAPVRTVRPLTLIGFMGSGKSVIGALVAYRASAPFYDLDFMIETETGMPISQVFSTRGEPAFRAVESRLLPGALREGSVVALGGGTVMNDDNWALIKQRSRTVYLELPFDSIWERIARSEDRPLVAGRLRDEVKGLFDSRRPRYEQAEFVIDADRSPDDVAGDVLALW